MIPLIAWDVVYTGLAIVRENLSVVSILKNLVLLSDGYHLYYIYVLIQLFLITPFLYKYIKLGNKFFKFLPLAITPLYCLILELLQLKYNVKIPLYNYFLFGWFTYYYLGILIKSIYINKKKICSIGILLVFTLIVSILYRIVIFREFSNYSLATSQILFINVFYSSLVCIFLLSISKNQTKINKNSIIKKTGDYSFGIYLSHVLILMVVRKIFNYFTLSYIFKIILIFLSTYILSYLINKIYYKNIKEKLIWKK